MLTHQAHCGATIRGRWVAWLAICLFAAIGLVSAADAAIVACVFRVQPGTNASLRLRMGGSSAQVPLGREIKVLDGTYTFSATADGCEPKSGSLTVSATKHDYTVTLSPKAPEFPCTKSACRSRKPFKTQAELDSHLRDTHTILQIGSTNPSTGVTLRLKNGALLKKGPNHIAPGDYIVQADTTQGHSEYSVPVRLGETSWVSKIVVGDDPPKVVVESVDPEGASITVNGKTAALGVPVTVEPGDVTVTASAKGCTTWSDTRPMTWKQDAWRISRVALPYGMVKVSFDPPGAAATAVLTLTDDRGNAYTIKQAGDHRLPPGAYKISATATDYEYIGSVDSVDVPNHATKPLSVPFRAVDGYVSLVFDPRPAFTAPPKVFLSENGTEQELFRGKDDAYALAPGTHSLVIRADGFEDAIVSVVAASKQAKPSPPIVIKPKSGTLALKVSPPDAEVLVDGRAVAGTGSDRVIKLDPNSDGSGREYSIQVRREDYLMDLGKPAWEGSVTISRGSEASLPAVTLRPDLEIVREQALRLAKVKKPTAAELVSLAAQCGKVVGIVDAHKGQADAATMAYYKWFFPYTLGQLCIGSGDYAGAVAWLRKADATGFYPAVTSHSLGWALAALANSENRATNMAAALAAFEKAYDKDKPNARLLVDWAVALKMNGSADGAAAKLKEGLALDPALKVDLSRVAAL